MQQASGATGQDLDACFDTVLTDGGETKAYAAGAVFGALEKDVPGSIRTPSCDARTASFRTSRSLSVSTQRLEALAPGPIFQPGRCLCKARFSSKARACKVAA